MTRPLVVELVGPAGVGKSTLVRMVCGCDPRARAPLGVWGLPPHLLLVGAALLIPTLITAWWLGQRLKAAEMVQMVRMRALALAVVRATREGTPWIVLDEGPVFALSWLEVFFGSHEDPPVASWRRRTLAAWAAALDAVVLLDAADDTLAQRIRARAKSHLVKQWSESEIHQFLARYRHAFRRALADLTAAGPVRVETVDTERSSPTATGEQLQSLLKRLADGR